MNKKKILFLLSTILISGIILLFIYNDDFLYKNPILKITKISIINKDTDTNDLGIVEKIQKVKISGVITNTKNKGKEKSIIYEESYSKVVTEKYEVGDKVFIKNNELSLKRDSYIATMLAVLIFGLCLLGSIRGLLIVISVLCNTFLFLIGLNLYFKGVNLTFLIIILCIIFSIFSIFISCGNNKKCYAAITSSIASVLLLSCGLLIIVGATKYNGVNFNGMSFLTVPPETIFTSELIISGLGAIMDVCVTMSSSISELIEKDKNISNKNLKNSTKAIGKDILNTMINVLFFTYLASLLPIFVLAIRNGFTVKNFITSNFSLEITRFLLGGISIVMSIPISSFISIKMLKEGDTNE